MLDAVVVQLVHCAQAVAGQLVDVDDVVGAAEHPDGVDVVGAAEHPDGVDVVGAAEHPDGVDVTEDDVVGAFAEQPCGAEVVVVVVIGVAVAVVVAVIVVDDVWATTPTTPTIESATAAATRKTAIFFMLYLSFFR